VAYGETSLMTSGAAFQARGASKEERFLLETKAIRL
jgi:hypothetical protein